MAQKVKGGMGGGGGTGAELFPYMKSWMQTRRITAVEKVLRNVYNQLQYILIKVRIDGLLMYCAFLFTLHWIFYRRNFLD